MVKTIQLLQNNLVTCVLLYLLTDISIHVCMVFDEGEPLSQQVSHFFVQDNFFASHPFSAIASCHFDLCG